MLFTTSGFHRKVCKGDFELIESAFILGTQSATTPRSRHNLHEGKRVGPSGRVGSPNPMAFFNASKTILLKSTSARV